MRTLSATLVAVWISAAASAAPLQITGKVLDPPREVQIELRPWSIDHADALRRLKGETVAPIASAKARPDGRFAIQVPDTGFYSVLIRAEGRLAMERFVEFVVEETEVPPVELLPVSPLEIRAVGPDGQPLAGVTILALPLKPATGEWRADERSAVTDAEGRAVFPRAEGEALNLIVTTPGRYATASTGTRGASETVRFPAPRSRTIEIRGPNNKPAAGALVRLALRGWPYGLTGEDGRIALPVPEKEEVGLVAEDARGLRIEIVMTAEAAEGTDVPVVSLRSPTLATGRVVEASTREPVPGALVWNGGTAWTHTGAGGTFELRAPSGNRGRIEGTAPGHTRDQQRWQRDENVPVTITLERAAAISGQVVDEAGKPLEGAEVTTVANSEDMRRSPGMWSVRSGPDGRFALRQLPAGRPHSLKAMLEGFAPTTQVADSKVPVRLVLRRGATVVGRVVDGDGVPVAGADLKLSVSRISVMSSIPLQTLEFTAVSGAEGRFSLRNVSAGRFDLRASRRGFAAALVPGVTVAEGEPRTDVGEIALKPGGAIEGIVVDESGRPVEGAAIMMTPGGSESLILEDPFFFHRRPIETGADGRFRIEDLPRGRQVGLEVMHQDLVAAELSGVEVPTAEPLRIELGRSRRIEGRVTDRLGEPVAGARVIVSSGPGTVVGAGSFRGMRARGAGVTEPDGRFVLGGLKPGVVDLQVSATGYRTRTSQGVRIPEDGQAPPVEIVLEPGTWLEGSVLDSGGRALSNASVQVQRVEPSSYETATTDEEGHYEIGDLEPGEYLIRAAPLRGGATARTEVEIRPGRNRLDLRIPAGTEVSGRVVDFEGSPLQGVTAYLERQPGAGSSFLELMPDRFQAVSSADGTFMITGVPDGDYRLTGRRSGLASSSLPGGVRVAGGPVAGLELRLGPAAAIRGQILGIPPEQTARVMISAHSEEMGLYLQGVRNPSGGYRIDDVSPGTWRVTAFLPPQAPVNVEVQVSPGQDEVIQDLEFAAGFTVTGRVLLDRSPLAGAEVLVQSLDPENPAGAQRTTGHDGSFRLERLPEGSYRLMVLLPTSLSHVQKIDVSGDRDLIIEVAAGDIEGRLLTAEGLPVAGAGISLRSEDPELAPYVLGTSVRSDDQGAFELPRVAVGAYTLLIEADGFARAESPVVVTPGGTVHVDLALKPETR